MAARSSTEVMTNFKINVESMKNLKKLNAFVFENIFQAKKDVEKAMSRRNSGSTLSNIDGLTFAVKDNLSTKNIPTTCASEFLRRYCPPYTASSVQRLQESGAIMMGKTNMDEFGMGSSTLYSCHGPAINPWTFKTTDDAVINGKEIRKEEEVVCGGSSGGSAAAVAAGMCDFALGSDTGGSVRLPASFCGVVGLKPTYGRVSRYGLIPLASSMDCVGVFASDTLTTAHVLDIISGFDVNDSTTSTFNHDSCTEEISHENDVKELLKNTRVGIPKDIDISELNASCKSVWLSIADKLSTEGKSLVSDVSLPHFKYGVPCYNVLNCSEATSNMAKYSGLIFGQSAKPDDVKTVDELFTMNRVKGLGPVVQHRIIAGMYFLSYHGRHHYEKALKVRGMIHNDFQAVFSDECSSAVDVLITPVTLGPAPYRSTMEDMGPVESSIHDTYTVPVNLAGLPAMSIPVGLCSSSGLPLGIQVIGKWMDEKNVIKVGRAIELITSKELI